MSNERQFHCVVLQYAPNPLDDAVFNIGVILFDPHEFRNGFCDIAYFPNWQSKVAELDPQADIDTLELTIRDIEQRLRNTETRQEMLRQIEDSFSNTIRASPPMTRNTLDPQRELQTLMYELS